MWSVVALLQSDCMILWSSVSLGRIAHSLWFFVDGDIHQVKVTCERPSFGWMWLVVCAFEPIRLQGSLIINICGKNQVIFVFVFVFCCCCFFLRADSHQKKVAPETTIFWLVVVCCVSYPTRLKVSLIRNKTGKNH